MEQIFNNFFNFSGKRLPKPEEIKTRVAKKLFDFADKSEGLHLTHSSLNVGPSDDPLLWLDNLNNSLVGPEFREYYKKMKETKAARYKILHFRQGELIEIKVDQVPEINPCVQPMPENKYLLATSCRPNDDLNAFVVDSHGAVLERFGINTAIESLQVTKRGDIWVGYFDEGAFEHGAFACFDRHGMRLYPKEDSVTLSDWCIGLNVESDNCVWLLPSAGPLSKVEDFKIIQTCEKLPISLTGIFAIAGNLVCWAPMIPAYSSMNFFTLSDLDSGTIEYFQPVDESGQGLGHQQYAGRNSKMYFISGQAVYVLDVAAMHI